MRCSSSPATVDITVIDNSTQQQGTTSTVTLTSPTTNAGTLIACGVSTTQFINYTLDGTNISITSANAGDSLMAYSQPNGTTLSTTVFTGARFATNDYVTLRFNSPATPASGTYPAISVSVQNFQQTTLINPFNIIVTNFPAVGGFFEGSFTGQFTVSSNTHTLSGTFRFRRLM